MKENKSVSVKLCQKKDKLNILNTRYVNKKLNRKKVLNNRLKSENKELKYELAGNLENLKEQATKLQKYIAENEILKKKLCYYKAKTRKLEADKEKKNEYDLSLKLEDLKEQVKFLEDEKLLLKEQLDNLKTIKFSYLKKANTVTAHMLHTKI